MKINLKCNYSTWRLNWGSFLFEEWNKRRFCIFFSNNFFFTYV